MLGIGHVRHSNMNHFGVFAKLINKSVRSKDVVPYQGAGEVLDAMPTKEQLEEATSHVKVFEKARKLGQGQVDFDGIRIEMPTYLNALEVIKRFNELKQFN